MYCYVCIVACCRRHDEDKKTQNYGVTVVVVAPKVPHSLAYALGTKHALDKDDEVGIRTMGLSTSHTTELL